MGSSCRRWHLRGNYNCSVSNTVQPDGTVVAAATGVRYVTFNTPMPTAQYSVTTSNAGLAGGGNWDVTVADKVAQGFTVWIKAGNGDAVNQGFDFQVNATNANLPATVTQEQIEAAINNPGVSAWGNVASDGTLDGGLNISSVENTGTGIYLITFATAMPNSEYSCLATPSPSGGSKAVVTAQTATTCTIVTQAAGSGTKTNSGFNFAVFATNALPPRGTTGTDAWGSFSQDGVTNNSYNCTISRTVKPDGSVVAADSGIFYVRFNTPMPTADYSVTANTLLQDNNFGNSYGISAFPGVKTTEGFTILTSADAGGKANWAVDFAVNATNANLPVTITQEQIDALVQGSTYSGVSAWGHVKTSDLTTQNTLNSTITKDAVGKYQITFDTPMPNADYAVTTSSEVSGSNSNSCYIRVEDQTVNGFKLNQIASGGFADPTSFGYVVTATNAAPPKGGTGTDAWGFIPGNQYTLAAGYNCTTAQNGTSIDVTFNTPMPSANYAVTFGGEGDSFIAGGSQTANGFTFTRYNSGSTISNQLNVSFTVNATNAVLPATITQEQLDAIFEGRGYNGISAWAYVNEDGTIENGLNIQNVTPPAGGLYTVTFETPMPNADYAVAISGGRNSVNLNGALGIVENRTTESFTVRIFNSAGSPMGGDFSVIVAATNAAPPRGGTGTDAWGNVDDDGTLNSSYNVKEVTRTGNGADVVFTTPMPNANYLSTNNY